MSCPAPGPLEAADADLARLFSRERRPMVRMATLLLGSGAVAEEVVQDAFLEVGQRWSSLDRPGAYLRRCVVNGCSQILRRRSVEQRYVRLARVSDSVELPVRLVEVRDALDRLTERQRAVVVLRYFVDIPDEEIAEVLEVRPATVRSLAHRALAVLRKELK